MCVYKGTKQSPLPDLRYCENGVIMWITGLEPKIMLRNYFSWSPLRATEYGH